MANSEASGPKWHESVPQWGWGVLGAAIGLFDFGLIIVLDANMVIGGRDATIPLFLLFLIPYAALGWAFGGLAIARRQADADGRTIRKQLRDLERTQRALVQEEKLAGIGRLAAGVAHEVRNPLGVIRASASMAREHFDDETDPHRALGFVCDETDRLDRLIHALLTFAKPQSVECVETDLGKVIDRALELTRTDARDRGVALDTQIASSLPRVKADPDRLSQALSGLTLNAIQAIAGTGHDLDHEAGRVSIKAEADERSLFIEVCDDGPGIPADLRDQIFEPFVTTKDAGTGLGLPMAIRLVEAQGGRLELVDEPGDDDAPQGACFRITLSLDAEGVPASRPADSARDETNTEPVS